MKLFFQIFGGVVIGIFTVVLGNVVVTKYQLYETNKLLFNLSSTQKPACGDLSGKITDLRASNKHLSKALIAAQNEIKAFKSLEAARSLAFSKSYDISDDCLVFQSDRHMVECQNKKRLAREEFYQKYK